VQRAVTTTRRDRSAWHGAVVDGLTEDKRLWCRC
jgi:hypothetical protein